MRNEQAETAITYHRTMLRHLEQKKDYGRPQLNIARTIAGMSRESIDERDKEMLQEYSRLEGLSYDPQRIHVPFSACRDMSAGIASSGGYLVSTETSEAVDILRPFSVTTRAGIVIETGLVGNLRLSRKLRENQRRIGCLQSQHR